MKIEWNKVTWYSKIAAVVLFVLVFFVGFSLGKDTANIIPNSIYTIQSQKITEPINIVSYSCDGDKTILAKYYQGESKPAPSPDLPPTPGGSVSLTLSDGRFLTLNQTISADGTRYADADESFVFWSKGNTAFISEGNPDNTTYAGCIIKSKTTKP